MSGEVSTPQKSNSGPLEGKTGVYKTMELKKLGSQNPSRIWIGNPESTSFWNQAIVFTDCLGVSVEKE